MNFGWEKLAAGVYRCRLAFLDVTVGVVAGRTGALLIDSGSTTSEARGIAEDVETMTGLEVTDVVLTHHHFDHILGSAAFDHARIIGAGPVAAAIDTGAHRLAAEAVRYGADRDEVDRTVARLRLPDRVVGDVRIDLGDRRVTVTHPGRGHTDHDLVVIVPPRGPADPTVVFCGDLIEESADPSVDAESDLSAWPRTVGRVLDLGGPAARYVPGHGAVVDAEFLVRQQDWLRRAAAHRAR